MIFTLLSKYRLRWQVLLLITMPLKVLAGASEKTSANVLDPTNLMTVFGSLMLVFACIFGLVFLLKKVNGLPASDRTAIRVLGSKRVGSREKIILIEAGKQQLLIGATPNSIRTLHVFDSPVEGLSEVPAHGLEFSSFLGTSASSRTS